MPEQPKALYVPIVKPANGRQRPDHGILACEDYGTEVASAPCIIILFQDDIARGSNYCVNYLLIDDLFVVSQDQTECYASKEAAEAVIRTYHPEITTAPVCALQTAVAEHQRLVELHGGRPRPSAVSLEEIKNRGHFVKH